MDVCYLKTPKLLNGPRWNFVDTASVRWILKIFFDRRNNKIKWVQRHFHPCALKHAYPCSSTFTVAARHKWKTFCDDRLATAIQYSVLYNFLQLCVHQCRCGCWAWPGRPIRNAQLIARLIRLQNNHNNKVGVPNAKRKGNNKKRYAGKQ